MVSASPVRMRARFSRHICSASGARRVQSSTSRITRSGAAVRYDRVALHRAFRVRLPPESRGHVLRERLQHVQVVLGTELVGDLLSLRRVSPSLATALFINDLR